MSSLRWASPCNVLVWRLIVSGRWGGSRHTGGLYNVGHCGCSCDLHSLIIAGMRPVGAVEALKWARGTIAQTRIYVYFVRLLIPAKIFQTNLKYKQIPQTSKSNILVWDSRNEFVLKISGNPLRLLILRNHYLISVSGKLKFPINFRILPIQILVYFVVTSF